MAEEKKEVIERNGCKCGWPIDRCWKKGLKKHDSCGMEQHDREVDRLNAKTGIEAKAHNHEVSGAFYRRTASLIKVNE